MERALQRQLCACPCVQLISIYALQSVLRVHMLQITVCHCSAPLKFVLPQLADFTSL